MAIDTSTLLGSVGWFYAEDGSFAECLAPARPGHAETLLARIDNALSFGGFGPKDVDLIVFGRGPGTFTGLRIGLASVKGIAIGADARVIGMSSLEALALSARKEGLVACVLDAKRKELFGALYKMGFEDGMPVATPVLDEFIGPAAEVLEKLARKMGKTKSAFIAGNGVGAYRSDVETIFLGKATILPEQSWAPSAYWMARVGLARFEESGPDNLDSVEPKYLREPDARLPGKR